MSEIESQARNLYAQHEYAAAREIYDKLLKENPHDDNLMIMLGNCFDGEGDKKSAAEWYDKARRKNPHSLLALTNLATALYETGSYAKAQKFCEQALKLDDKNLPALINMGNIFYQQSNYDSALSFYRRAYEINSGYYIAAVNLANTYIDLKNYAEAAKFASFATELDSSSVTAWTILGNAQLEQENFSDSLRAFQQAVKLDSSDFWLHNYLSQVWQKMENWEQAFAEGWQALELSGGEDSQHINFGYLLYESSLGKKDSLLKEYAEKWLKKYPENSVAKHMGNAVLNHSIPLRANDEYLTNIFDVFAPDFEQVLSGLDYQAPELIRKTLARIYPEKKNPGLRILDAGCGTGFCGVFLQNYSRIFGLYGVDISEKMLEQAKAKKCYSRLIRAELESYFSSNKKPFDLIVSADVFTYFGDLQNLFAGIASNLKKNSRIIFTVTENNENKNDYFLHPSGRYLHHKNYVKKVLKQCGLQEEFFERERLRNEGDSQVWGYMVSAVKE